MFEAASLTDHVCTLCKLDSVPRLLEFRENMLVMAVDEEEQGGTNFVPSTISLMSKHNLYTSDMTSSLRTVPFGDHREEADIKMRVPDEGTA